MQNRVILTFGIICFLLIALTFSNANAQTKKLLPIGISYDQIMRYLGQNFPMVKLDDVRGLPCYSGTTSDNHASLEIIGDRNDVSKASLSIGLPDDAHVRLENLGKMMRFIKNVAPELEDDSDSDWFGNAFERVISTGKKEQIVIGNKLLEMNLMREIRMLTVTIKHKDSI